MTLINIKQGESTTHTDTITTPSSLSGYTGKMYIYTRTGTSVATVTGVAGSGTMVYTINNEVSKLFPIGLHDFETKIFDSSDHVYVQTRGSLNVESSLNSDPS